MSQADSHVRSDSLGIVLLSLALLGPIFHWLGILLRGISFFYADFIRLIFAYLFLSACAGAAAWLVLRPISRLMRLLAIGGLLLNLASIAYAGRLWRANSQQLVASTTFTPINDNKIGIIIAPVSASAQALAEAHTIEETLVAMAKQSGMDLKIEVRQVQALTSSDQAQQLGSRLQASVVIWGTQSGSELLHIEYYVTSLGARNAKASLEPIQLMLLLATIDIFNISNNRLVSEVQVPTIIGEVIVPTALGFSALATDQPVLAAGYFQTALAANRLTTETLHCLEGYLSLSYLFAGRPDLAQNVLARARETELDASTWLFSGYLALYQGDQNAANESFMRARALTPHSVQTYSGLGIVQGQLHNISRALSLASQAVGLQPSWGIPYILLAQAHELAGDVKSAQAAYERARLYASPFSSLSGLVSQRSLELAQKPPTPVPTAIISPTASPMPIPGLRYHTVVKQETLQKIAAQYNVSVNKIVQVNKLKNQNVLYVGQVLIIPDE
ncbi:MAG: LysM peptidoglycan-binding domain-containing protein [Anaerolineae bacterium]